MAKAKRKSSKRKGRRTNSINLGFGSFPDLFGIKSLASFSSPTSSFKFNPHSSSFNLLPKTSFNPFSDKTFKPFSGKYKNPFKDAFAGISPSKVNKALGVSRGLKFDSGLNSAVRVVRQKSRMNPFADYDKDGVPNWVDCRPKNKRFQDNVSGGEEVSTSSGEEDSISKVIKEEKGEKEGYYLSMSARRAAKRNLENLKKLSREEKDIEEKERKLISSKKKNLLEKLKGRIGLKFKKLGVRYKMSREAAKREKAKLKVAEALAKQEALKEEVKAKIKYAKKEADIRERLKMERKLSRPTLAKILSSKAKDISKYAKETVKKREGEGAVYLYKGHKKEREPKSEADLIKSLLKPRQSRKKRKRTNYNPSSEVLADIYSV